MRAPAVSFAKRFFAALMAALLTVALAPASALAEGEGDTADAATEEPQEVSAEQVDEGSGSTSAAPSADGGTLASALVGTPTTFINSDVALDGEPIIGSFTVDGLTFAVTEGSNVELVGVSPNRQQVANSQEGDGSPVAPMLASGPDGSDANSPALAVLESVTYNDVDYAVTSIGAYAFYLSGVTDVELPASVGDVDDRAFRSSDVVSVSVADGNASYSSFDGALYDAEQLSLLLIPEGKQGTVLLPMTAESAAPSVFSHCPLVTQIAVEEGSAAFASENGLLYDASLTTLLRVPAGATDIVIRDGCTTIAAGAMEACASLATITAPASVTSISPDVFMSVPTISLTVSQLVTDGTSTQLSAMVALSVSNEFDVEMDPSYIKVMLGEEASTPAWRDMGFSIEISGITPALSQMQSGTSYSATSAVYWFVYPFDASNVYQTGYFSTVEGAFASTSFLSSDGAAKNGVWRAGAAGDFSGLYYEEGRCAYLNATGWRAHVKGPFGERWERMFYAKYNGLTSVSTAVESLSSIRQNMTEVESSTNLGAQSGCSYYIVFDPYYVATWDVGADARIVGQSAWGAPAYGELWWDGELLFPEVETKGGMRFLGWTTNADGSPLEGGYISAGDKVDIRKDTTFYAVFERCDYNVSFNTSSEPGDEDYPGIEKPDETLNVENGPTVIEDQSGRATCSKGGRYPMPRAPRPSTRTWSIRTRVMASGTWTPPSCLTTRTMTVG